MEDAIASKQSFWQGIAAGFLAGVAVAAALRYSRFEKFLTNLSTVEGKLDGKLASLEERLNPEPEAFFSRRDQPESAGDPATLASSRTGATAGFTRRGGAPHGSGPAEVLEVPGQPGTRVDHIDAATYRNRQSTPLDHGSAG